MLSSKTNKGSLLETPTTFSLTVASSNLLTINAPEKRSTKPEINPPKMTVSIFPLLGSDQEKPFDQRINIIIIGKKVKTAPTHEIEPTKISFLLEASIKNDPINNKTIPSNKKPPATKKH